MNSFYMLFFLITNTFSRLRMLLVDFFSEVFFVRIFLLNFSIVTQTMFQVVLYSNFLVHNWLVKEFIHFPQMENSFDDGVLQKYF
jgi:hypothetical protein